MFSPPSPLYFILFCLLFMYEGRENNQTWEFQTKLTNEAFRVYSAAADTRIRYGWNDIP